MVLEEHPAEALDGHPAGGSDGTPEDYRAWGPDNHRAGAQNSPADAQPCGIVHHEDPVLD